MILAGCDQADIDDHGAANCLQARLCYILKSKVARICGHGRPNADDQDGNAAPDLSEVDVSDAVYYGQYRRNSLSLPSLDVTASPMPRRRRMLLLAPSAMR